MRVTKLIREYVEAEVTVKFKAKRSTIFDDYEAKKAELKAKIDAIAAEANEKAIAVLKDAGFEKITYGSSDVIRPEFYGYEIRAERDKLTREADELERRRKETINSILISLEIGEASKNDLKDLLDAVKV